MSSILARPASDHRRGTKGLERGQSSNPFTRLVAWIWQIEVWAEGTFALAMMELWEKLLVCELSVASGGDWRTALTLR